MKIVKMTAKPNFHQLEKWGENLSKNIPGNMKPLFQELAKLTSQEVKKVYDTEGYGTWQKAKRKRNPRLPLLVDTRKMIRASIAHTKASSIEDNRLIYGLNLSDFAHEYPARHEEGRGNTPRRSIWNLVAENPDYRAEVFKRAEDWIGEKLEKESKKYFN